MKKELLAPAGDIEAGYAALYYGADAVYLGLKQFSARATADNFTEDELGEFTAFAHHLGRKVFVTINTVLQTSEVADLLKNLEICKKTKVDAVILQDLGVAGIVKKYYPELEMHASTQMAIHNKQGAEALKKFGFSRVVLARELTVAEMKEIATIPDLELEAFVHGALCYSYSGICQFSSFAFGRSANRGKCLYPCRAKFEKDGQSEHCFSMKDMALEEDVLKMPVYSLKIEGRKKSALYVAAVTDYYRNILDGNGAIREKAQNIKQIFSRPWCKFHFVGRNKDVTDKKFVGHRGLLIGKINEIKNRMIVFKTDFRIAKHDGIQIDVAGFEKPFGFSLQNFRVKGKNVWEANAGDEVEAVLPKKIDGLKKGALVYLASSSAVKGAYDYKKPKPKEFMQRIGVDVEVDICGDKISAKCGDFYFEVCGVFTKAREVSKTTTAVKEAFAKTGDTIFDLNNLSVNNPDGLFVPKSLLNELRRGLYDKIEIKNKKTNVEPVVPRSLPVSKKWIVKVDNANYLTRLDMNKIDEIILQISPNTDIADILRLPKQKLRLALPTVCRKTKEFEQIISKLIDMGYKKWEIANYYGLEILPINKIDVSFDNPLYMFNTYAIQTAKDMKISRVTLAVEDTLSNVVNLANESPLSVALVVYQDVPLFTSAVCIRENACKDCDRMPKILDLESEGQKYWAVSENCQLTLFNQKPFCIAAQAKEVRADFYRADFAVKKYSSEEVKNIMDKLMRFEDVASCQKGNIIRRGEFF